MRNWLMKYGFTVFFLAWEARNHVRGAWRRREWRKLGRYGMYLLAVLSLIPACAALVFFW